MRRSPPCLASQTRCAPAWHLFCARHRHGGPCRVDHSYRVGGLQILPRHFPKLDRAAAAVVVIRSTNGVSVLGHDGQAAVLNAFSSSLNQTVWNFEPGKPQIGGLEVDGYTTLVCRVQKAVLCAVLMSAMQVAAMGKAGETEGRKLFISPHEEAAIILIQASASNSMRYLRFVDHINDGIDTALAKARSAAKCPRLPDEVANTEEFLDDVDYQDSMGSWGPGQPCHPDFTATQTGLGMFTKEALEGVEHDLEQMDMIAMPIALGVLAFVLRSWRLMLLPCICIGTAAALSFGVIMLPVSYVTQIISFAPSVMMSCTVAMSIDYSLFLLSRYQEEVVQRGQDIEDAVHAMLCSAGHTVLVSGVTLMVCWLGLAFFPVTLLSSAGLAASFAILAAIVVNLCLTPVLIFTFPTFFYHGLLTDAEKTGALAQLCCGGGARARGGRTPKVPVDELHTALRSSDGSDLGGSSTDTYSGDLLAPETLLENDTERRFYRLGKAIISCRWAIVLLFAAATVPMLITGMKLKYAISLNQMTPRNSVASQSFDYLQDTFGAGNAFAYTLIVLPPEGQTIMSEQFFAETSKVVAKIAQGENRPAGTNIGTGRDATWPTVTAAGIVVLPNLSPPPPAPLPAKSCEDGSHPYTRQFCKAGGLRAQNSSKICINAGCCWNSTNLFAYHCFEHGSRPPTPPAKPSGAGGTAMWAAVQAWQFCKNHPEKLCDSLVAELGPILEYTFDEFVAPVRTNLHVFHVLVG